jgi:hypothetical protein
MLLAAVMLLGSCRSRKSKAKVPAVAVKPNELVQYLRTQQNGFNYFSSKIKAEYEGGEGKDANFTLHLKMQKDQFIWISVTGLLGIEGFRIFITPDSVKILDKLNRKYMVKDYSYFNRFTDVPFTITNLQNLFIGNQLLELNDSTKTDTAGAYFQLKNLIGLTLYTVFVHMQSREIQQQHLAQAQKKQELTVHYSEFKQLEGVRYANKIELEAMAKEQLRVTFDYQNVSLATIDEIIFNIPSSYSPVE